MNLPYNTILSNQIAEPSNVEKNTELYGRVRNGDAEAREVLIETNMALVLAKVDSFIRACPSAAYLYDDLVSAGFMGLVEAVNQMASGAQVDKPTGYMSASICYELGRLVETESPVVVSYRVRERAKANGQELQIPKAEPVNLDTFSDDEHDQITAELLLETRNLIDSCCESDGERSIVQMRAEGYSDQEIADRLGVSRQAVQWIRRRLHTRYTEKEEAIR